MLKLFTLSLSLSLSLYIYIPELANPDTQTTTAAHHFRSQGMLKLFTLSLSLSIYIYYLKRFFSNRLFEKLILNNIIIMNYENNMKELKKNKVRYN